ncbi:ABC transporter permease [Fulvivirga lutimaris]|uniref:ABC transporter permease n=1 Tax=Fulvivirga lutimaris TaxID=1819566 RepID=UPI0012BC697D|nr:ABC transporter permease [Fulvivirga lutimaris]MTI38651.1 ABC transporter permease [Fulvivirga lutimaris]
MLKNYIKIAFRNLANNIGYTSINISGLAIGLSCCFLIALYVQFELSYEDFHTNKDQLYRYIPRSQNEAGIVNQQTWLPPGFGPAMSDHFGEVEAFSRYSIFDGDPLLVNGEDVLPAAYMAVADKDFFNIFSFNLLAGKHDEVLARPFTIVISESVAKNFFPDKSPIGQSIRYNSSHDLEITGVFEDVPKNSHLQFEYIVQFETIGAVIESEFGYSKDKFLNDLDSWNYSTYFMINDNVDTETLEVDIEKYFADLRKRKYQESAVSDWLQPIDQIHFTTGIKGDSANGNINNIYIFSAIAIFILVIACFNFMNLSTARAMKRAREVGVRKVLGAQRYQLIYQFLGETILLTFFALVLSLILLEVVLPIFNSVMGFHLTSSYIENFDFVLILIATGIITGVLAGSYPAFYLSAFDPAKALKEASVKGGNVLLRQVLTVLQFGIAAFLIIGTFIVTSQMRYMTNKDLGFNKEEIIYFMPPSPTWNNLDVFRNNLSSYSEIKSISTSNGVPGYTSSHWSYSLPDEDIKMNINTMIIDYNFVNAYDLEIVDGRNISTEHASDSSQGYLINETAAKQMMLANPVGTRIQALDGHPVGQIVGVVKDFHYKSLHQAIEPLVLRHDPRNGFTLSIKFNEGPLTEKLAVVEQEWKKFAPEYPFNYQFLDEDLDELYKSEQSAGWLMTIFSSLAIIIACLGLFGLTSFLTEQRKKEIGVRKVMGASVNSIVGLLSKDFTKLVLIAFIVAIPVAWYAMEQWLSEFAYQVSINPLQFVLAGLILIVISLITISYQSLKAATANPAETLRSE